VFPYAKRDLRDIATTMGISYENLVKMSMAQTKLNQISSEFKFSGFDKDDQQLIANFAQFSKEKNAFIVKVDGKEKLIAELGKKDVEALRGRPETLEEIAQAPLTETELLIAAIESLRDTFAGVSAGNKMTQDLAQTIRAGLETTNLIPTTLTTRMRGGLEKTDETYKNFPELIKEIAQDFATGKLDFAKYLEQKCLEVGLKRETFCPKKGDILFWHAGLVHGGSQAIKPEMTRKSYVTHYSTKTAYPRDRRALEVEPIHFEINKGLLYEDPLNPSEENRFTFIS
jgi:hypothetical protein